MTKLSATSIALFLAVAVLALGSCGGDDEGNKESATTGADATETTTGTTETTTGKTETRERAGKTDTGKRKREDKGGSSGGGSDDSSGSGGGGNSGSSPEKQLTGKNTFSTSETVCKDFLPTMLERDLKSGKTSAEEIAKQYSAGYPAAHRKRAYEGCLAGLKAKD